MAFRSPRLMLLHAGRAAGVSGLSASHTIATDFPLYRLIDERRNGICKFNASGSSRTLTIDRGAAGLEAVTRLLIPAGHNLSGQTVTLSSDDNSGFTTPTNLVTSGTLTSAQVDLALTSSTERYLRVAISGTGQWELGELVFTRTRTLTKGIVTEYGDDDVPNVQAIQLRSGAAAQLVLGEQRRRFALEWEWVTDSTDKAILLEMLAAAGNGLTFWLDPPDDTEAALPVLVASVTRTQDHPNPGAAGISYTYRAELVEAIG